MTKVLVVDDSALMRRLLQSLLTDAGFRVEVARNGAEGVSKLLEFEPDVVTLDINMPEMDGLTALSLIMEARPTPVVMVSSLTRAGAMATLEALALGAVDFVTKPGGTISLSIDDIAQQLIRKLKAAARSRLRPLSKHAKQASLPAQPAPAAAAPSPQPASVPQPRRNVTAVTPARQLRVPGLVVIGVSTGGPRTLEEILPELPASFPWPVLLAQHMPHNFTGPFAQRMDRICALHVQEVNSPTPLQPGTVYVATGGADMVVVQRLRRLVVQPCPESPAHLWHPSVDVLMHSALAVMPPANLVGVLLTGMGDDGASAMADLHAQGGRTIAESQDSAVVFGMPQELIARGGASTVLPCEEVAAQLCQWIKPHGA